VKVATSLGMPKDEEKTRWGTLVDGSCVLDKQVSDYHFESRGKETDHLFGMEAKEGTK